jgi:quinoprotein glucose dehydrogenase
MLIFSSIVFGLIGLVLLGGGLWLIVLGGSWYYVVVGIGFLITAVLLAKARSPAVGPTRLSRPVP